MRTGALFVLLLLAASAAACNGVRRAEDDFGPLAAELPACGLRCALANIPFHCDSTADPLACICNDDALRTAIQACLRAECTLPDMMRVARADAESCGRPERSRKQDNIAALAVEVPAWFALWARMYSRWVTMRAFATDDYVMMAAGLLYTVFMVLGQLCNSLAFGQDIWMVDPEKLTKSLKLFYVDESLYLTLLVLTKVSLLFFYLRIFPQQSFRAATFAIMAFVIVSGAVFLLLQIFQCSPIRYSWEGWQEGGAGGIGGIGGTGDDHRCVNVNALSSAAAAFSIAQDLFILALPLPVLYGLNMTPRRKAGIMLMFSLGIFVVATSCTRLHYVIHFARSANPTWDYTDALMWSGLEVAVSIIVTSLPAIRVLLARTSCPRLFHSSRLRSAPRPDEGSPPGRRGRRACNGCSGRNGRANNEAAVAVADRRTDRGGKAAIERAREWARPPQAADRRWAEGFAVESGLELGERAGGCCGGGVLTRIGVEERRPSSSQPRAAAGENESGIHVQTMMTTTTAAVDPRRRAQEPRL